MYMVYVKKYKTEIIRNMKTVDWIESIEPQTDLMLLQIVLQNQTNKHEKVW